MTIPYKLIRSSRKKSIGIEVSPYRGIIVRAPRHMTQSQIATLLDSGSGWIRNRIELLKKSIDVGPRTYTEGDRFLFLGEWLSIKICGDHEKNVFVQKDNEHLKVCIPVNGELTCQKELVKNALASWYHEQATLVLRKRVAVYAPQVGVSVPTIQITNARKRWGSCGINGRLNFPWRLMMAPLSIIDYVVVHELCHLKRRDHSSIFWGLVYAVLPDFRERRRQLKEKGPLYDL